MAKNIFTTLFRERNRLKQKLTDIFKIQGIEELKLFLGMNINKDKNGIYLNDFLQH